jgi:PAS domain S-box-containing protein
MLTTKDRDKADLISTYNSKLLQLCRLTAEVARLGDERATLQKIVDTAARLLEAQGVHLALVDRGEKTLYGVVSSGRHAEDVPRLKLQLSQSTAAQEALRTGRPVVIGDAGEDPRVNPQARNLMNIHGIAYMPLKSGEESFGLLIVVSRSPRDWKDEDIELATQFAAVASVALENSHLMTQLARTEKRLRSLIEHIPAIIYVCEPQPPYRTSYISPQAQSMLGYTPSEWVRDPESLFMKVIHPDDIDQVNSINARDLQKGFCTMEYRIMDKTGELRWFRDEAVLMRDPAGSPIAWHGVMVEITGLKKMQH